MVVYLLPLFIGAAVAFTLLVYTFLRRQTPGAFPFTILMAAIAVWMLGYAFELTSGTQATQYFWRNFAFLGIAAIPAAFLVFVFQYTSRQHGLPPRLYALISGWLIVSLGLVWSNPLHGLFWSPETRAMFIGPLILYTSPPGPMFWVLILGIYILLGAGVFWLYPGVIQRAEAAMVVDTTRAHRIADSGPGKYHDCIRDHPSGASRYSPLTPSASAWWRRLGCHAYSFPGRYCR